MCGPSPGDVAGLARASSDSAVLLLMRGRQPDQVFPNGPPWAVVHGSFRKASRGHQKPQSSPASFRSLFPVPGFSARIWRILLSSGGITYNCFSSLLGHRTNLLVGERDSEGTGGLRTLTCPLPPDSGSPELSAGSSRGHPAYWAPPPLQPQVQPSLLKGHRCLQAPGRLFGNILSSLSKNCHQRAKADFPQKVPAPGRP